MKTSDIVVRLGSRWLWLGKRYGRFRVLVSLDSSTLPCRGEGLKIVPSIEVGNSLSTQHCRADGNRLIIRYQDDNAGDVVVATDKKQYQFDIYMRNDLVVHQDKISFRFTAKRSGIEEFYGESDTISASDYACYVEMSRPTDDASTKFLDVSDPSGKIIWYTGDGQTKHWLEATVTVRNKVGGTIAIPEGAALETKLVYDGGEDAPKNVIHPPKPSKKKKKKEDTSNKTAKAIALLNQVQVERNSAVRITVRFRIEEVSANHSGRPFRLEATVAASPPLGPVVPGRSDPILVKSKPPAKKKEIEHRDDKESTFYAELVRGSTGGNAADTAPRTDASSIGGDANGSGGYPPPNDPPSRAAVAGGLPLPPPVPPGDKVPYSVPQSPPDLPPLAPLMADFQGAGEPGFSPPPPVGLHAPPTLVQDPGSLPSGTAAQPPPRTRDLSLIAGHPVSAIKMHLSTFPETSQRSPTSDCSICGSGTLLLRQRPCLCDIKNCSRLDRSIHVGEKYYEANDGEYCACVECYTGSHSAIAIENGTHLKKHIFQSAEVVERKEAMLNCSCCLRPFHAVCGLSLVPENENQQVTCPSCLVVGAPCSDVPLTAESIPATKISSRLETHVRTKVSPEHSNSFFVRHLSSTAENVEVDSRLLKVMPNYPRSMPYRSNCFAIFQRRCGIDVLFFILYAHEYGSDCDLPNKGTVYLSYLEKVDHVHPKEMRRLIIKELLVEYIHVVQNKGFRQVMIWSSPPMTKDLDYIFNAKPNGQKLITQDRLNAWYGDIINTCVRRGICTGSENSYDYFIKKDPSDALSVVPYLKGDVFSMKMIEALSRPGKKTTKSISSFLREQLAGDRDNLFLLPLANGANGNAEADSKVEIDGGVFRDRSDILRYCIDKGYQFDQLRRAKHASTALVGAIIGRKEDTSATNVAAV